MDGQIRELDEPFEIGGRSGMYPGGFGAPSEDCRCRCAVLQRARWALDEDELETLKERAAYFGLDKTNNFADFKEKYLKSTYEEPPEKSAIRQKLEASKIEYKKVERLEKRLTTADIIEKIGGGELTQGSCSSLAFAYSGNKNKLDVLDFRGGDSCSFFAKNSNILSITNLNGVESVVEKGYNDIKVVDALLHHVEKGKEYYLATGEHAAIIRHTDEGWQYLELQDKKDNGFKKLTKAVLKSRFGCKKSHKTHGEKYEAKSILIDTNSLKGNKEFENILGYINTAKTKQKKGVGGHVK
ncbi:MAG: hypothetical protein RR145_03895 [Oscillospiraceae bacterium]